MRQPYNFGPVQVNLRYGDTGWVFRLFRPSDEVTLELLATAGDAPTASPQRLTLAEGLTGGLPKGFVHDRSYSEIGRGARAFETARNAIRRWEHFNLGWVRIANPTAPIEPGQLIAMEAHTVLWSVNLTRITEVVDRPDRFGFLYTTTAFHVEEGQERFLIQFDPATEVVSYLIEAFSRPRHPLARMGYPFSRAMQHRFARESHARMRSVQQDGLQD